MTNTITRAVTIGLMLAGLALVVPAEVGAAASAATRWGRAVTKDANANGLIDAVWVLRRARTPARRCEVMRGDRRAAVAVGLARGRRAVLSFPEAGRPDTASRPLVRCSRISRGRGPSTIHLRATDGAAPVALRVIQRARGALVVAMSEPVRVTRSRSRRRADLLTESGRWVRAWVRVAGARVTVRPTRGPAAQDFVAVRLGRGVVRDRHGNPVAAGIHRVPGAPAPIDGVPLPLVAGEDTSIAAVMPTAAAAFLDSIGINVHLAYVDTAYKDFAAVKGRLQELGVRHVRDGACAGCVEQQDRLRALGAAGIKANLVMGRPGNGETLDELVAMVDRRLGAGVASLEGPNEYDLSGDPAWITRLRTYQQELYRKVRAHPRLAGVPVWGPAVARSDSYSRLGDLSSWQDCGNVHPYSGGDAPEATLAWNLTRAKVASRTRPVCVTESGYHNALATTSDHRPASEPAAGAYVPRMYLEYFRAGVPRTFLYELVDQFSDPERRSLDSNFGLLRSDFSEKPAFRSLRRLLRLTAPGAQSADVAPLRIQIRPPLSDVQWLLLQRDAKEYSLVVWRNIRVWNPAQGATVSVAPVNVEVVLGQRVAEADVTVVDGAERTPGGLIHLEARSLVLPVGGEAVVARLRLP